MAGFEVNVDVDSLPNAGLFQKIENGTATLSGFGGGFNLVGRKSAKFLALAQELFLLAAKLQAEESTPKAIREREDVIWLDKQVAESEREV